VGFHTTAEIASALELGPDVATSVTTIGKKCYLLAEDGEEITYQE